MRRGSLLCIRLYPELSRAALKAGLHKELCLWYELRAINVTHMGKLPLEEAVASLVSNFDYTESTAYRLLKDGRGKLWEIKDPPLKDSTREWHFIVKIKGLEEVAEYLGTTYTGRPVEIKASDFRGRGAKTAGLYASFFNPEGSKAKPISRASIEAATGVERRQQKRYDKVAGIKRVPNYAVRENGEGILAPIRHLVAGKCREWLKDRQLGNTYYNRALTAPRGMTKRINAELRHRSLNRDEMACVSKKRFFLSANSLLRTPERHADAFILVNARDRVIRGRVEWCSV